MVFDATFVKTVKVDGVAYTAVAGVVTVNIAAGAHTITKGDTTNLYFMSVTYITGIQNTLVNNVAFYPNPALNSLTITSDALVKNIEIFSLTGILMQHAEGDIKTIDVSRLNRGSYVVKVITEQDVVKQVIIKN